jgi:hypothetical protein
LDSETAKIYNKRLIGLKASCGITINSASKHALMRLEERKISLDVAVDLIENAEISYPGNIPGTMCQQKDRRRVVINKVTGNLISFVELAEEE